MIWIALVWCTISGPGCPVTINHLVAFRTEAACHAYVESFDSKVTSAGCVSTEIKE